jgi:hypothetical protein
LLEILGVDTLGSVVISLERERFTPGEEGKTVAASLLKTPLRSRIFWNGAKFRAAATSAIIKKFPANMRP